VTLCRGCHEKAEQRRHEILEATVDPHRQELVWDFARSLRIAQEAVETVANRAQDDVDDEDLPF
jgi:hypothetical protein